MNEITRRFEQCMGYMADSRKPRVTTDVLMPNRRLGVRMTLEIITNPQYQETPRCSNASNAG